MKSKPTYEQLKALCDAGLRQCEIAEVLGLSKGRICTLLKEYGLVAKNRFDDDEYKDKLSKSVSECWTDSEYRHKQTESHSHNNKIRWQNEEYRNKISTAVRNAMCRPDVVALLSKKSLAAWTPERRLAQSKISKLMWTNDEYASKIRTSLLLARVNQDRSNTSIAIKVRAILDLLNVKYRIEEILGPWAFDIFIPDHNLLIEVQGDYWHSLPRSISNDKAKATYVERYFPQYKLHYVWEHECLEIGKVEAKLRYWLGLDKLTIINYNLHDLHISTPDRKTADTFLYNWHYQHHGRHGLDIGGFLGDELICVARFTSPTRKEVATSLGYRPQEVLELARLCVHPRYQKKNLLSWFLARCEKQIRSSRSDIRCLVSFADSTFNHTGAVYKASNWKLTSVIPSDYWYVGVDNWMIHKKTLWNHASKMGLTESEYVSKHGYIKVWGKEKYKFIKVLK